MTAENIGEIVDQSHEFAMRRAEYFDVLHKTTIEPYGGQKAMKSRLITPPPLRAFAGNLFTRILTIDSIFGLAINNLLAYEKQKIAIESRKVLKPFKVLSR